MVSLRPRPSPPPTLQPAVRSGAPRAPPLCDRLAIRRQRRVHAPRTGCAALRLSATARGITCVHDARARRCLPPPPRPHPQPPPPGLLPCPPVPSDVLRARDPYLSDVRGRHCRRPVGSGSPSPRPQAGDVRPVRGSPGCVRGLRWGPRGGLGGDVDRWKSTSRSGTVQWWAGEVGQGGGPGDGGEEGGGGRLGTSMRRACVFGACGQRAGRGRERVGDRGEWSILSILLASRWCPAALSHALPAIPPRPPTAPFPGCLSPLGQPLPLLSPLITAPPPRSSLSAAAAALAIPPTTAIAMGPRRAVPPSQSRVPVSRSRAQPPPRSSTPPSLAAPLFPSGTWPARLFAAPVFVPPSSPVRSSTPL